MFMFRRPAGCRSARNRAVGTWQCHLGLFEVFLRKAAWLRLPTRRMKNPVRGPEQQHTPSPMSNSFFQPDAQGRDTKLFLSRALTIESSMHEAQNPASRGNDPSEESPVFEAAGLVHEPRLLPPQGLASGPGARRGTPKNFNHPCFSAIRIARRLLCIGVRVSSEGEFGTNETRPLRSNTPVSREPRECCAACGLVHRTGTSGLRTG
jgi:hypothetical protein